LPRTQCLQSCLQSLNSYAFNSNLSSLTLRIKSIRFGLGQSSYNIQFDWIPSHEEIRGNEIRHSLTKSSSNFISPSSLIPRSDFTPLLRRHVSSLWSAYWNNLPANFASKFKSSVPNIGSDIWFKHISLSRSFIIQFNRLRIGHYILPSKHASLGRMPLWFITYPFRLSLTLYKTSSFNFFSQFLKRTLQSPLYFKL